MIWRKLARGLGRFTLPAASAAMAIIVVVPTAAWAAPFWPVSPASPQARSQVTLFWIVIAIAFVFLFVVLGVLVYVMLRFRARPGQPEPRQIYGNQRLELWWTAIPMGILVVIFGFTVRAVTDETAIAADALPVAVVGHQWWWEFRYPTLGVTTANELQLPVGRAVHFTLESADVIHTFWFPELGGKEQTIPGTSNVWTFTPERAGEFEGACSEYCGVQHAWMRMRLIVQTPQDFDAWVEQQRRPPQAIGLPEHQEALRLWSANACGQCHTIAGLSSGIVGPDLTHAGSRGILAGGVLKNDPDNMTRWLRDPQRFKPGSYMPNLHLDDQQAIALARFLEDLK